MLTRKKVIETIKKLPATFSIDGVIDRLLLLEKIEYGIKQSKKGQVTPDNKLESKLPEWLV